MRKENKNQKQTENKKVDIVKRKDYLFLINFFKEIKDLNLEIDSVNREKVKEIYLRHSKNKVFSNIERVIKRSLRQEIKTNLEKELSENNLSLNDYLDISRKVIYLSRDKKKATKFLEVAIEN